MTKTSKFVTTLATILSLTVSASAARAALAPDIRCEVGQLKTTATYASCRLKTEAKALSKMLTPDFTKCEDKFNTKFPKYEVQAGPTICPSEGDVAEIRGISDDYATTVALLLAGGSLPTSACGDGTVDLGEQCDVGNLDGETCATQGFFNGTLACGPGCTFVTSDCNLTRFEDNGGTVLDHQTGLEWEKKDSLGGGVNLANPHDADNLYTWAVAGSPTTQSGALFSDFLVKLNGTVVDATKTTTGCFENHCDWRIPTVDELKSIQTPCGSAPCVIDALLLPNASGRYWSNSTNPLAATGAYFVEFLNPGTLIASDFKSAVHFARAVRTQP